MKRIWPIIGVRDVQASSKWYQSILACRNSHPGGSSFDQILDTDGTVLLCLHHWGDHEHPSLMSPDRARPGNGLLLFFRVDDFDAALQRTRALVAGFNQRPHENPNTGTMEFSVGDPDGYYVTISGFLQPDLVMKTNRSAPTATVVPVLVYDDVATALDWLAGAFGFRERLRAPGPDGNISHAQLAIAEGAIMIGRSGGPFRPPRQGEVTQYVVVHVADVDQHFERAKAFGAQIVKPPADMPFGERQYTAADPEGHRWTFSQHIADVAPEQWGAVSARYE